MSPESQRKAIAEAHKWEGWYCTKCKEQVPPIQVTYDEHHSDPDDMCGGRCEPSPDYLNDLNAMHEAEKVLDDKWMPYARNLLEITTGCGDHMPLGFLNGATLCSAVQATAAQRAEAFLRTLNLWTE